MTEQKEEHSDEHKEEHKDEHKGRSTRKRRRMNTMRDSRLELAFDKSTFRFSKIKIQPSFPEFTTNSKVTEEENKDKLEFPFDSFIIYIKSYADILE